MMVAEVSWHQDLDLLTDELARFVSEQSFSTLIRDPDISCMVGNDRRIGSGVEDFANDIGG